MTKTAYATQKTPVRELTSFELQELFSYTKLNRQFKNNQITRDQISTAYLALSDPVQTVITRNSTFSFTLID